MFAEGRRVGSKVYSEDKSGSLYFTLPGADVLGQVEEIGERGTREEYRELTWLKQ